MELSELYNENGEKLGKAVNRHAYAFQPGEYVLCVGVWIFNSKQEIFLTKRSPEKRYMPGKWENPAGHVIAGETGREAMARELREETGIQASPEDFLLFARTKNVYSLGEEYVLYRGFPVEQVTLQEGETCACRWVSETEYERMAREGELAASVVEHLAPNKARWRELLHKA